MASQLCFVFTLAPVMAGVQTATDNKAVLPSKSEVGTSANDLSSTLAAYVEKLQKAVDEALTQAF